MPLSSFIFFSSDVCVFAGFAPFVFLFLVIGCTARPFYPLPNNVDGGNRKPLQTFRPYNIAHRGSNGEIPEETSAAYTVKTIFVQNYILFLFLFLIWKSTVIIVSVNAIMHELLLGKMLMI